MINSALKNQHQTANWIKTGKWILGLMLFGALSTSAFAQVSVDAKVDADTVENDDSLTLSIIINASGNVSSLDEPELPNMPDFVLLNKFVQNSVSSTYVNGKFQTTQSRVFNYLMSPQKTGKLRIDPVKVTVNGTEYRTRPLVVTVLPKGSRPQPKVQPRGQGMPGGGGAMEEEDLFGNDPFGDEAQQLLNQMLRRRGLIPDPRGGAKSLPTNDREAFFVTVEVDKTRAFVGEQITANWYLYTKGNIQNYDALKYPELRGFWKEEIEMPTRLNLEQVNVNGAPYGRALLLSSALFPIAPGKKTIDSYKAKATIIDLRNPMGVFGMGRPMTYVKASKEMPIEVKPLPAEGRPKSFSGAVGSFKITGSLSSAEAKVNQPVSLKLRFQGQGNVKVIELPPLNLPSTLEVYDTKKEAQFMKTGQSFKEFEVLLIPRAPGKMVIPAIPLSYFDPTKGKYVTDSTPEFTLNVKPGDGASTFTGSPMQMTETKSPQEEKKSGGSMALKSRATWALSAKSELMVWLSLFLVTWGFWGLATLQTIREGQGESLSQINKKRVAQKLKLARQLLKENNYRGVGVECSNAVLSTLGTVTGSGGASLSLDLLLEKLPAQQESLKGSMRSYLNRCEVVSFAPEDLGKQLHTPEEGKKLLQEAEKIISQLYNLEPKSV